MTTEERMRIAVEVTQTAELFGEQMSEGRLTLYVNSIEYIPIDAAIWALREARRRCKFFPKPAEIHELIQGSPDDTAALAWTRFLRAISDVGTYTSVNFGDHALHATIEALGGWHNAWQIVRLGLNELGFKRHEFLRTYTAFKHVMPGKAQEIMLGQHAIENRNTRGSWTQGHEHHERYVAIEADGRPGETKQLVASDQRAIAATKRPELEERLTLPEILKGTTTSPPKISEADREAHRRRVLSQALSIRDTANTTTTDATKEAHA